MTKIEIKIEGELNPERKAELEELQKKEHINSFTRKEVKKKR